MAEPTPSLYQRIGDDALRAVVVEFYRRVFADVMIGYMFEGKDRQRLIDKEVELTARFLGGGGTYTGQSMRAAHARLQVLGGQFDRRLQILRNVLRDLAVDAEVAEAWIDHQQAMRDQITSLDCAT